MTVDQPGTRYTMPRVLRYVQSVEAAYNVSLKFWLELRAAGDGSTAVSVLCWGSGSAFDLLPEGIQPRPSEVYLDEQDGLGEAIYYSVLFVERYLGKLREPVGSRPSL